MNYDPKIKVLRGKSRKFYAEHRLAHKSSRLVDAVKNLKGVELEIRKYCLYVLGNTFPHKRKLLKLKFKWDWKKKQWYKAMTFTRAKQSPK